MLRIRTVGEGVQKFKVIAAKYDFAMVAKGDVKTPEGLVMATIWVAEKSRKNDFDMLYAIENYDGVLVRRGESAALDSKRRIEDAMKDATEMLTARREAREAIRQGALH